MKYKSDILEMIHENAVENFKIGAISAERMREYDEMCLAVPMDAAQNPENTSEEKKRIDLVAV